MFCSEWRCKYSESVSPVIFHPPQHCYKNRLNIWEHFVIFSFRAFQITLPRQQCQFHFNATKKSLCARNTPEPAYTALLACALPAGLCPAIRAGYPGPFCSNEVRGLLQYSRALSVIQQNQDTAYGKLGSSHTAQHVTQ